MRYKLKFLVILVGITSLLFIYFDQCDSDCRRPRISDALEDGRHAALLILTGKTPGPASGSAWSRSALEKTKGLQEFYLPASQMEDLVRELGVQKTAPLFPEVKDLEPVALETWENAALVTYKYELFEEVVEIGDKGPLLISVSLRYAAPSEPSWMQRIRDHVFPSSWIVSSRWLMNLGRSRGNWTVIDFNFTGTLNEYLGSIQRNRHEVTNGDPSEVSADTSELMNYASAERLNAVLQADTDFMAKWSQETATYQVRRFHQTREEWNEVERAIGISAK